MNILIATIKTWNINNAKIYKKKNLQHDINIVTNKEEFEDILMTDFKPDIIFFPHWSWIIQKEIYERYECILFHMTDLPYGKGGSPLQNLIIRKIEKTKISAIRVDGGIDTGDIYIKENLDLSGSADEILKRASFIIFNNMIPYIIKHKPMPIKQIGTGETFQRRTQEDSEIKNNFSIEQIYDYIRMLDGEGYPNAYINYGKYKIKFSKAKLKDNKIIASVEIREEYNE